MLLSKMASIFTGPASPKKSFCHCFTTGLVAALVFHRILSAGQHGIHSGFLDSVWPVQELHWLPTPSHTNQQIVGILIFYLGKKFLLHGQLGGLTVTPLTTCIFLNVSFKVENTEMLISSKFFQMPGKAESLPSIRVQQYAFPSLYYLGEEQLKAVSFYEIPCQNN